MSSHTVTLIAGNLTKAAEGLRIATAKSLAAIREPNGKPWVMELREQSRTDEQNNAIHGLIDQIMKQRPILNGVKMDKARYKATFMHALGHEIAHLPTLDGRGVFPMGLSTSKLNVREFCDLIEFVLAWCAEQDITIKHFDGEPAQLAKAVA